MKFSDIDVIEEEVEIIKHILRGCVAHDKKSIYEQDGHWKGEKEDSFLVFGMPIWEAQKLADKYSAPDWR